MIDARADLRCLCRRSATGRLRMLLMPIPASVVQRPQRVPVRIVPQPQALCVALLLHSRAARLLLQACCRATSLPLMKKAMRAAVPCPALTFVDAGPSQTHHRAAALVSGPCSCALAHSGNKGQHGVVMGMLTSTQL